MNPTIEVTEDLGEPTWQVRVTDAGGATLGTRTMAATSADLRSAWPVPDPAHRPPTDDASWDIDPAIFASWSERIFGHSATREEARSYGRYLFDALLGSELWAAIDEGRQGEPLVVGLRLPRGSLFGCAWDLIHDGVEHLALRPSDPVLLTRLVADLLDKPLPPVVEPPSVLFAVGSSLDDRRVRAGAEVMAVLRDVARRGKGAVTTRVRSQMSVDDLEAECQANPPDIVHLVGYGDEHGLELCGTVVDASALVRALVPDDRRPPRLVVLSAADTAGPGLSGAPLAGALVDAGVPLVVAMGGRIGDTACRLFARSLVAAITLGTPLVTALTKARSELRREFASSADRVDWALPAVFARFALDTDTALVNSAALDGVRQIHRQLELAGQPVFAGRHETFGELDELLDDDGPGTLVLYSEQDKGPPWRAGGTRVLKELAAAALRRGHLPIRVTQWPADQGPPAVEYIALEIVKRMEVIVRQFALTRPTKTLKLIAPWADSDVGHPELRDSPELMPKSPFALAEALRDDLIALSLSAHASRGAVFRQPGAPVLLLDGVDGCAPTAVAHMLAMLGPNGLGYGSARVPVVLYGREHSDGGGKVLADHRRCNELNGSTAFAGLPRIGDLDNGYLAFLAWALSPGPQGPGKVRVPPVAAPALGIEVEQWRPAIKVTLKKSRDFYEADTHWDLVHELLKDRLFVEHDDDAMLEALGMLGTLA